MGAYREMSDVRDLLRMPVDPEEHEAIRELWKRHSISEDNRDIAGLLSTLTDDCAYELVGTEHVWHGPKGQRASTAGCSARSPTSTFS